MLSHDQFIEQNLNARVNPERNRKFSAEQFEANRRLLEKLAREAWLKPRGLRISVVGSNGKGSTAFYLAHLFQGSAGPVGLFTSPHLSRVQERIRFNLKEVDPAEMRQAMEAMQQEMPEFDADFSYFEYLTLLAAYMFGRAHCGVSVYEAGLGGRLDCTRIASSQVVVLTRIVQEHAELLGQDLEGILNEKLGIITGETRLLLCMPQPELSRETILAQARLLNPGTHVAFYESSTAPEDSYLHYNYEFAKFCRAEILKEQARVPFEAPFALPASPGTDIPPNLPGRLESRPLSEKLQLYYDTAHNPPALELACRNLKNRPDFPGTEKCLVILGLLKDRDAEAARETILTEGFQKIILADAPWLAAVPGAGETVELEKLDRTYIEQEALKMGINWIIMMGTHRMYTVYQNAVQSV